MIAEILLGIIITVVESEPAACPPAPPRLVRLADGRYTRSTQGMELTILCWSHREWQERWTDLPEHGGQFLERILD